MRGWHNVWESCQTGLGTQSRVGMSQRAGVAPVVAGHVAAAGLLVALRVAVRAAHVPQLHALVLPVADEMHAVALGVQVRHALCE